MLFEPSTIASVVTAMSEAMEKNYELDIRPLLKESGIDLGNMSAPGARLPDSMLDKIFQEMIHHTGDDCVGLAVGEHVRPTTFHALGYAWLASSTLRGAFRRLVRFDSIVSTGEHIEMSDENKHCVLTLHSVFDQEAPHFPHGVDAYFTAILKLCRLVTDRNIKPSRVRLKHSDRGRAADYVAAFDAPVEFAAKDNQMFFQRTLVDSPLRGRNTELALASDRMAERYQQTQDSEMVASAVRDQLLRLLPTGTATQQRVADQLHRSTSALQRQLRAEDTSFREILNETRKSLAIDYIRDGKYSLAEVAFLIGYSDQSNFSRAFRRWTGSSPANQRPHH